MAIDHAISTVDQARFAVFDAVAACIQAEEARRAARNEAGEEMLDVYRKPIRMHNKEANHSKGKAGVVGRAG